MDFTQEDTIAAISTPPGYGGIAIVRISGSKAIEITQRIFRGNIDLAKAESWKAYHGYIVDKQSEKKKDKKSTPHEQPVDEVIVTVFRAPNSYTREDVVEISCHGGVYLTKRILELILREGARLAEPGEFTRRAFLNGRLDLSQAEAVADLIRAKTELSLRAALSHLQGRLSRQINTLRDQLVDICSFLELELDFSEEDLELVDKKEIICQIDQIVDELDKLLMSFSVGKIVRDGARLVIVGRPNVGKSSLLNALLKEERAIVTDVPGTTRDSLEEQLDVRGMLFRVIDTAGLGTPENKVELEGIKRTQKHLEEADVVLMVLDRSEAFSSDDQKIIDQLNATEQRDRRKVIYVVNKIDLKCRLDLRSLKEKLSNGPIVEISAKRAWGLKNLEQELLNLVLENEVDSSGEILVTKIRHQEALQKARENLVRARQTLSQGVSSEFAVVGLRSALDNLGEIVGTVTSEDILNNIFSKFCIGK